MHVVLFKYKKYKNGFEIYIKFCFRRMYFYKKVEIDIFFKYSDFGQGESTLKLQYDCSFDVVLPYLALPYLTLPCLALPCLTLPYLTLPYLTLPYLTLPYLTLPYLTLPYLTLPYLTLPYLTLPYLTLPYLTLPYLTLYLRDLTNLSQDELDNSTFLQLSKGPLQ